MLFETPNYIFSIEQILIIETFEHETELTLDDDEQIMLDSLETGQFMKKFDFIQRNLPSFLQFGNKFLNMKRFCSVKNLEEDGVAICFNNCEEIVFEDEDAETLLDALQNLSSVLDAQMEQILNAVNN